MHKSKSSDPIQIAILIKGSDVLPIQSDQLYFRIKKKKSFDHILVRMPSDKLISWSTGGAIPMVRYIMVSCCHDILSWSPLPLIYD